MKILWTSNSNWAPTGYGVQTGLFLPRLQALGHDVAEFAFYGLEGRLISTGGPTGPIPIYPRAYHPYGIDVMGAHAKHFGADINLSLMDAWVIDPGMMTNVRWVPWFPVDSEPLAARVRDAVSKAYRRIVFSKFGERMVNEAGMDCYYVPHGVDTKVYQPMPMAEARARLNWHNDKFIVTIVAANKGAPSRKAFYPMFRAWAQFIKKHPDTMLYVHTCTAEHGENQGENLLEEARFVGLQPGKDIFFPDQYMLILGYPPDYLNDVYNASDAFMLVSMGEGFGVPIVEAQASGCPVIVGDWTAMSELCFSGWKVPKSEAEPFHTPLDADQFYPHAGAIYDRLCAAYEMRGNMDYRKRARDGAVKYDADTVTERYWKPVLEDIEQAVEKWKPAAGHKHTWHGVGLYNPDGSMSIPCKQCGAELRVQPDGSKSVTLGGFANPLDLKFTDPDGLEWLLMREVERDYKPDELHLTADSVVVDIGAHVGVVSMTLAKRYGCKVYAYEPNPGNFWKLVGNVAKNELPGVLPHNFAVTGDGRDVQISTNADNSGGGDIYSGAGEDVRSATLADILVKVGGTIDLLKIDCEGAEFEILTDTESLRHVKAIRGEFHRGAGDADALLAAVKAVVPDTVVTMQGAA